MPYYVYTIYNNARNKIYIGQTADLEQRLKRHNGVLPSKRKAFTTKNSGEWKLVYSEKFHTRQEAIVREKALKSFRGREFLKKVLKSQAPIAQW